MTLSNEERDIVVSYPYSATYSQVISDCASPGEVTGTFTSLVQANA